MRRPLSLLTLVLSLVLTACVLSPGKFTSDLTIGKDRSFTFRYQGEVIALDPTSALDNMPTAGGEKDAASLAAEKADREKKQAEREAKYKAMAEALAKEQGVRKISYAGDGKFMLEYEISGTLDHGFVFPFNTDAEVAIPFLAIELRKDGTARVKAPGFVGSAKESPVPGMGALGGPTGKADGVFTIRTDADVLMHNNEAGLKKDKGWNVISWRVTPLTKEAPTLSLQFAR
jgi:hypothetical protein